MDPVRPPARDPDADAPILDALLALDRANEAARLASEAEDRVRADLERAELASREAFDRMRGARDALVRAVIEGDPREVPTIEEWHFSTGRPLWSARVGGRVVALVASGDRPDDIDFAVDAVALAVFEVEGRRGG